ncbi:lipopolysaccharide assembly protein LapB [Bacteroides sp. 51]|uniref:tetratricopeptide repeat protein n=1 Tax=Bacteroides sp. 51 TaxID=2302938 RepID=UPI0013D6B427|nr:tetratricopeptide repeat protein [Bacteroides sp. 51]NDV82450.1 tetratricopeptide repeat protein [Bacteroides sp. 51]
MKNKIHLIIFTIFAFISGCKNDRILSNQLIQIDSLINDKTDSILIILEDLKHIDIFDNYNRAYYNLLYIEAQDKNGQSIINYDSLLNDAIDKLSPQTDKYLLAKALFYKGQIWEELNEPTEVAMYYHKAIGLANEIKDNNLLARIFIELGNLYIAQELFTDALDAFQKGYFHSNKSNNDYNTFISLRNMGVAHLLTDQLDSAFTYFNNSYEYAKKTSDSTELINSINNDLAIYYHENKQYKEALSYLQNVSEMNEKHCLTKGDLFLETKQYDSAYHYLSLSERSDNILVQINSWHSLHKLKEIQGDFKEANYYLNKFIDGYDSVMVATQTSEIHTINQKYNIKNAIAKLERQHTNRIISLIILIVLLTLATTIIYITLDRKKKVRQKIQEQEILKKENELLEKEIEISNLLNQIAETKNTILKLTYTNNKAASDNTMVQKENTLVELRNKVEILRSKLIIDKPLYKKITKLAQQTESNDAKVLNPSEREELKNIIKFVYADLIEDLQSSCPSLTEEDILFCCLAKLNLSMFAISICTGYSQTSPSRQRKFRIKKKMVEETDNLTLYNSLFNA